MNLRTEDGRTYFELDMRDAWVWDMYRPAPRFVADVRVVTFKDVNVEELRRKDRSAVTRCPAGVGRERGGAGRRVVRSARLPDRRPQLALPARASSTSCVRARRTVVFCEVKTRRRDAFGVPAEAVTRTKQRATAQARSAVAGAGRWSSRR